MDGRLLCKVSRSNAPKDQPGTGVTPNSSVYVSVWDKCPNSEAPAMAAVVWHLRFQKHTQPLRMAFRTGGRPSVAQSLSAHVGEGVTGGHGAREPGGLSEERR